VERALKRIGYAVLIILLGVVAWFHLVNRIHLVTADLGRHIRNGELAVVQHQILRTNQYSYTYPDFPAPCHHWGTGVIFYVVWNALGFAGLSIFYGGVLLSSLALFTWTGIRAASARSALLAATVALPLVGARTEIRPEGFTALFLGLNFFLLYGQRSGKLSWRWLCLIPLVQLVWVNVHILFVLGLCLLGIFVADALVMEGFGRRFKGLAALTLASVALSFVNPFGAEGFFEAMTLFLGSYSYQILAEDQTVFWMMKAFPAQVVYPYFLVLLGVAVVFLVLRGFAERSWRRVFLPSVLLGVFGLMAVKSVRSIAMFGLVFIPLTAENWERAIEGLGDRWRVLLQRATASLTAGVLLLATFVPSFLLSPLHRYAPFAAGPWFQTVLFSILAQPQLWSGLTPGMEDSARFFRGAPLHGPVFNNYDIGGYFIFNFYPRERPFIDNRPEAYPQEFLRNVYGPMQANDAVWAAVDRQYGLQLIMFYRLDMTTDAQSFLMRRTSDPQWAPVFVDAYTLILAKRGGVNQAVIDQYEIPQTMFNVGQDR